MKNPRLFIAAMVASSFLLTVGRGQADPPWMDLVRLRQVEADPDVAYSLSKENGPWMILATTFQGSHALRNARELVFELRSQHKLPAYTHDKVFDYSKSFVGRGVDKYGEPRRMRHQNNSKVQEVAVLVGDYASVDDRQAQRDLKKIKSLEPNALTPTDGSDSSQTFAKLREMHRKLLPATNKKSQEGPMRLAFVTTNPLLPQEYFRPRGVDRFVEKLNRDMKHSLLDCPGRYTVKVATFNGFVAVNPETIQAANENRIQTSRLEEGALKAHKLTVALRAKGYDAYQFHDRNSSIVTVGSFMNAPVQRNDGRLEYEPQVVDLIRRFGAKKKAGPNVAGIERSPVAASIQPASLLGIPFDVHPTLIDVPKRSLSADYARRGASLR